MLVIEGDHNTGFLNDPKKYLNGIDRFLKEAWDKTTLKAQNED